MSGGWIDKRRRTILNFLVIRTKCIVFLESIEASYLSNEWEIFEIIVEVAEADVVQTVTDNAGNFKVVGAILMGKKWSYIGHGVQHIVLTSC